MNLLLRMASKQKCTLTKSTSDHKFKIRDKGHFANDFYNGKNPKLTVSNFHCPSEIININDTNAKNKFGNKIKVVNIEIFFNLKKNHKVMLVKKTLLQRN